MLARTRANPPLLAASAAPWTDRPRASSARESAASAEVAFRGTAGRPFAGTDEVEEPGAGEDAAAEPAAGEPAVGDAALGEPARGAPAVGEPEGGGGTARGSRATCSRCPTRAPARVPASLGCRCTVATTRSR